MNVLVFTSLYPNNIWPHHGVFVKERLTQFARSSGCRVKVVAPVPYYPPVPLGSRSGYARVARSEVIEDVEVYHPRYLMIPKVGMILQGPLMFLSVLGAVRRIRKTFDFDLIDAHYVYPDGLAAVLLGRALGRPVVVSARGSDINLFSRFPLIRRCLRYTLSRADAVIAVCQALKEAMVEELGIAAAKITVVPNGIDPEKFHPASKVEARARLGLPADKRVILSVGGLIPRKGFDVLIDAFGILTNDFQVKDVCLAIAGEGPSRKSLESLVSARRLERHVRFVGDVPHSQLYLWYNAADLFCLASSREGWPNVVVEALACGTPVVATSVWGIPEIIRSDDIGLLTPRTALDIATTLRAALQKPWQSSVISDYGRSRTWERVAGSLSQVFQSVFERASIAAGEDRRTLTESRP